MKLYYIFLILSIGWFLLNVWWWCIIINAEKRDDMDNRELLIQRTNEIKGKFAGINEWISNNPDTNPNFCEMINCIIEFGKLNLAYSELYKSEGKNYDYIKDGHDVRLLFQEVEGVRNELERMITLREEADFFENDLARELLASVLSCSIYKNLEIREINEMHERLLGKLASVYFYIWETKQKNPDYVYDNYEELDGMWGDLRELRRNSPRGEDGYVDLPGYYIMKKMYDSIARNEIKVASVSENSVESDSYVNGLNLRANGLEERYKGINAWIKSNPNTNPNFCEMMDCVVEYGKLTDAYIGYFEENGYPENDLGKDVSWNLHTIIPELASCKEALGEMINLRSGSEFFKDELGKEFFERVSYYAAFGEYDDPKDESVSNMKKDVLCKLASVYFYIWETTQREPWYLYDNVNEWNEINDKYEMYKNAVGVQERKLGNDDEIEYEGPQFGYIIEKVMVNIEKRYKYSTVNETQYSGGTAK